MVANGETVRMQLEGIARIFCYDEHGRPTTVTIPDAVSDTRLKTLLSFGKAQRRGLQIETLSDQPHITLVSGRRLPLRRDGDILHLDFLVPKNPTHGVRVPVPPPDLAPVDPPSVSSHSPPIFDDSAFVASAPTRYVLDICAGTASALRYHALDPHAQLLAIDVLEPWEFFGLIPSHLDG